MTKVCVKGLESLPPEARGGVVTIGNFDGVHIGHQRILLQSRTLAVGAGRGGVSAGHAPSAVTAITFEPLPEAVLHPEAAVPPLVYPVRHNCQRLLDGGADVVVVVHTTGELLALSPREFVELMVRHAQPQHVVEGADFFFGRGRTGDVATLGRMGAEMGFSVAVVDPVVLNLPEGQRRVSSTLIRQMLAEGRVEDANYCLGREFALYGLVVAGEGRGRSLDFPTANLRLFGQVVPGDGVYAGKADIEGRTFLAAVSIGNKPTFPNAPRTIEAFLIDAHGDFYNRPMSVSLLHRLREQRKFENIDSLRNQIARNVENVRKLLE